MTVATERVSRMYSNVAAGTPISVDVPCFSEAHVNVYYGRASVAAALNSDYTVLLQPTSYNTFSVTPTLALLAKINALISADPTELNQIVVRRTLPFTTDMTPEKAYYRQSISVEFDRTFMLMQQLNEQRARSLLVPDIDGPDLILPDAAARSGKLLAFTSTGLPTPTNATAEQFELVALAAISEGKVMKTIPPIISDGVLTVIETDVTLTSPAQVIMSIGGVFQPEGSAAYGVSGTKIILSEPAPAGVNIECRIIGASLDIQGPPGEPGVGILSAALTSTGRLVLTLTNNVMLDVGYVKGEPGAQGDTGTTGPAGVDGNTVLHGAGAPSSGLGVDGDFYVDTDATRLYGPKTAGTWGSGVSLIGTVSSIDWSAITTGKPTTLAGYGITDAAPLGHVGAGGAAHANATTSTAGFMSAADKTKLDGAASLGANTFTADQNHGGFAVVNESLKTVTPSLNSGTTPNELTIDFRAGHKAAVTITGNLKIIPVFPTGGGVGVFDLTNAGAFTITFSSGKKTAGGAALTFTTSGIDRLTFIGTDADYEIVARKDIKA